MTVLARVRAALTRRAARHRDDRALLRLARKDRTTVTDDPRRSPEWCHRHGCHRSQCPTGD
ncbi:hypothetical protein [Streptomyces sp. NPDC056188]|uniref:hypothetical protein n=1 Tax=Streptomyces sp. NPDC056188 TaxID=3345740 RepID=UPI0035E32AA4